MTKFFSQDKFLLGEVAPLYYHDKQVLSSGNGLKQALNTQILSGGQISKRCGFAFIDKLSDNKTPLRIIPFAYNRFYNYALVFYYKEDQGVFIDVYDNFGLLVQDSINTGYDVSEVLEIKYFQANDILFLHTFKSINMVLRIKGLFYLTTGDFRDYYELKKQKIGLAVIVSNDVYKVISTDNFFDGDKINYKFKVRKTIYGNTLKDKISGSVYQSEIFYCGSFSTDILTSTAGSLMLQASDDGVHWETQRSVNMQASSSVNLNWVDSGKKYFFKIISNNITCSTYSIVVDSFDLDIIFTVVSIETTRVALIDIENWNPFFDIYLPKDVNAIGSIIPVMTSATAPSGTVSFPQEQPISIYWETIGSYIVPTTNAIAWQRAAGSSTYYTVSIDYTFDSPVSLAEAKLYFKNINPFIYPDQGGFIYPSFYAYVSKFNAVLTDYSVVNINPKWGPAFNDRDTFEIISDSPVINNVVTISFSLTQVFNESQASGSQQIRLLGMIASGISQTQTIINFSSHSYIWGTRPSGGYAFSSVCGGITQNRYIYANYPEDNFDRIIFSAIDSFYDLDAFSVDDQSAFTLRLPALKAQKILELIPFNSGVLALTTEGEYLIYGQDGVITPASCAVLKLSENGNQSITPCNMGNAFIGVGKDNSLYYQKFTQEGQAYPRFTISDLAKHFFTGKTVKEIVFCRNPENNLYVLFTDGKMVKLFFREADNAIAWSRFEIDAFITSIASIEDDGKDRLCILTADGNILISDIYEDERAAYLDFYRKFTGSEGVGAQTANTPSEPQALTPLFIKGEFTAAAATAANPFTEGEFNSFIVPDFDTANKPVYAVCYDDNGCWIERVKEAPGEIHKLDAPAKLIYCGLFYDSGIETLDFGGYDDNFTAKKGKIDRVQPYFIETAGIEINGEKLKNDDLNNEYIHFLNGKYGGENGIPTFKGSAMEKTLKIKSFAPLPWTLTRLNLGVGGVDEQG